MLTIYIPTLGRPDNQITYFNLSKEYQDKVIFVIQKKESDHYFFKDKKTIIVDCDIGIAKTRQLICEHGINNSSYFCMLDDDLAFMQRENKKSKKIVDSNFKNLFNTLTSFVNEEKCIASSIVSSRIPPSNVDYLLNSAIGGFLMYSSLKLKTIFHKIDWMSCKILEDLYVQMQLIELGFYTKTSLLFCLNAGKIQTSGGCSSFRTNELFNDTICFLKKKYPRILKVRKGYYKNGGLKNSYLLKPTTYLNRLYKDSQSKIDSNFFFII